MKQNNQLEQTRTTSKHIDQKGRCKQCGISHEDFSSQCGYNETVEHRTVFYESYGGFIVATSCLGRRINLAKALVTLNGKFENPSILITHVAKVEIDIFGDGRLICSGTKTKTSVYRAIRQLDTLLQS